MKTPFIYKVILAIVFIASATVIYLYFRATGNSALDIFTNSSQKVVSNNTEAVRVADEEIPSVFSVGQLHSYKLLDSQTGSKELFVLLQIGDKALPAKIDFVTTTGRKDNFTVRDLDDQSFTKVDSMMDEVVNNRTQIDSVYLSLYSIQNTKQQEKCKKVVVSELVEEWCSFDEKLKSYTSDELVVLLQQSMANSFINVKEVELAEFLDIDGNVNIALQLNY